MAARRRGRPRDPFRWWLVRVRAWCARGEHEAVAGVWMRTRRDDFRELHSCEACLAKAGVVRPQRHQSFTFNGDAPNDGRARQAGGDD